MDIREHLKTSMLVLFSAGVLCGYFLRVYQPPNNPNLEQRSQTACNCCQASSKISAPVSVAKPLKPPEDLQPQQSKTINLLKLIRPDDDGIVGTWKFENDALVGFGEPATLEILYTPPEEYDFRTVFTRTIGNDAVLQILSAQNHSFAWCMGGWNNSVFSFLYLHGDYGDGIGPHGAFVRSGNCLQNSNEYESVVEVRRTGVKAFLNKRLIYQWPSYADFSLHPSFTLRHSDRIGVAAYASTVVFRKIEVVEISGQGVSEKHAADPEF